MAPFLPLFQKQAIFDFHDEKKVEKDMHSILEYFDTNRSEKIEVRLSEINSDWMIYLDDLLILRRKKLFNTEVIIPNEKQKIREYANSGNQIAIEITILFDMKDKFNRLWPIKKIESGKLRYLEWKKIPHMEEEAFKYLGYLSLKELYYPEEYIHKGIYKYEEEYKNYRFDFIEFMGKEPLYLSYLIFKKEGNEKVFDNMKDFIVNRYIPKPIISWSIYALLNIFMYTGNDKNGCNQFFTRRMKNDIYREANDYVYLTNSTGTESFEDAFLNMFYSNPFSDCNIKNPLQGNLDKEPGLIEQSFLNHLIGNYSAAINLLFPIIEGIVWDMSVAEHLLNNNIYTSESDLTNREIRNRTLKDKDGNLISKRHGYPTLQELLQKTKMNDIIHIDFFKMLIGEMYPIERNPILHGIKLDYNEPWQSSRLLLMLEYIHDIIKKRGYNYPEQLDPADYWTSQKQGDNAGHTVIYRS